MPNNELPIGCTIGAKSFVYKSDKLNEWSVYIGVCNSLTLHKERNKNKIIELSNSNNFLK